VVGIWEQTEPLEELEERCPLTDSDKLLYKQFTVEKRKREWLSSRLMLRELTGQTQQVIYDEFRNPTLENSDLNVSITHCRNYVAVFLDRTPFIGCDIEEYRSRIVNISKKFMSPAELEFVPENNPVPKLTAWWCFKEVLYKYYSRKQVDFKQCLFIRDLELAKAGMADGNISINDFKSDVNIHYLMEPEYFFAFASGEN